MQAFGQPISVNGTSLINIYTEDFITNLILILIPVIAATVIGLFTVLYMKKEHQRAALLYVFQTLGDSHKSSEENLYDAYRRGVLMKDSKLNSDHANPVAVVSKNYAEIGSMLASGMVPRDQYYYRFGIVTVVSYYILKEYIDQVRQDWTFHRANFANLAIDCFEYWNSVKNKPRIVDPKGNQIIREMLGEKIEKPKKRIL